MINIRNTENNNINKTKLSEKELNCLFLNARSILNNFKFTELKEICKEKDLDLIGIVETWLHSEIKNEEFDIEGYTLYRKDREVGRGGGIVLYVKNTIISKITEIDIVKENGTEVLVCEIGNRNHDGILVGVFYRPPNANEEINKNIQDIISQISQSHVLIMGDFNYPGINWAESISDTYSEPFLTMTQDCFLYQHVMQPTRERNVLDLILTSEEGMIKHLSIETPLNTSDHSTIYFKLETSNNNSLSSNKCVETYNYYKANYKSINNEIEKTDWDKAFNHLNTNEMWDRFIDITNKIIETHVPKYSKNKQNRNKWYNNKLKRLRKQKVMLWDKYSNDETVENYQNYKIILDKYTDEINKAKTKYEEQIATNAKIDSKPFYQYVKSKTRVKEVIGVLRDTEGKTITDVEKQCTILNEYFASVFNTTKYNTMPDVDINQDTERIKLQTLDIDKDTIIAKLRNLKLNKSPGIDNIPTTFLIKTANSISYPLLKIFLQSFQSSEVPEDWKRSNVFPKFKSGDKLDPSNYRPISLTCHICKVFESIVKDEIATFLNTNTLIKNNQHGFVKNKSCLTNLLTFTEYLHENLDKGDPVDVFYLDFRKAFDRVPIQLLIHKLNKIGLDGKLLKWIQHWLTGRTQRVVIDGKVSTWTEVLSGVPQGSVLGPILFTIYINDLGDNILNKIIKFADDTKTYGRASNQTEINSLQNDLNKAMEWAENWGMEFNKNKCKIMHVGNKNKKAHYFMGGEQIQSVEQEKDLGVIITNDIKVSNQCIKAAASANRTLGMIKRTFTSRSRNIIVPLYKSLIRPHLEFCIQAWRPHLKKDIDILEKIQKRATKCIKGMQCLSYEERLKALQLPSLEYRRVRGDLIEMYKMYKGWSGLKFSDYFETRTNNLRGHTAKIYKQRFNTNIGKYSFSNRTIDTWNQLPNSTMVCNNINTFKGKIDKFLQDRMGLL